MEKESDTDSFYRQSLSKKSVTIEFEQLSCKRSERHENLLIF
jgi:hypothetical protein